MVDVLTVLNQPMQIGSDTPADVRWTGGGSAANTACWLAAAGVDAVFVGRAGADLAGRAALDGLTAAGVAAQVGIDDELPTGTCVVLVDHTGERTMIPSPGANAALSAADVDAVRLDESTHLHVSGYALFGGARDAARFAIGLAHAAGATVSIGAASAGPLATLGAHEFLTWSAGTTVFANRDEAAVLTGLEDQSAAAFVIGSAVEAAVLTSGATGSIWSDGGEPIYADAELVDVVDTTGAGDAFAAGYLATWLAGGQPGAAMLEGHRLAARACGKIGGRPTDY
ncbi:MAG: hypothetical protein QOG80_2410 [Pseudonocardiales bacterium]|jgi:sugar/nucleoside kinase (ribokinase family)|nr:hypothetical protein [Pseudonocardiales bacterium]